MFVLFAFAVLIIIIIIAAVADSKKKKERLRNEAEKLTGDGEASRTSGTSSSGAFSVNHEIDYMGIRFAISSDRQTAYLINDAEKPTVIVPVSSITGCDIVRDGNSAGSVGRAIAGGIIAGGVGAIVGASTGSGIPRRYSLLIYINDLQNPSVEYSLLDRTTPHSKSYYEKVEKFAESVAATVRVIVSQNQAQ